MHSTRTNKSKLASKKSSRYHKTSKKLQLPSLQTQYFTSTTRIAQTNQSTKLTTNKRTKPPHHAASHTSSFHTTIPQRFGVISWLKNKFDSTNQGELMGQDPNGHTYFEWVDSNSKTPFQSPTRRTIKYHNDILAPDQVHELWETWLRHGREFPPSPQEVERYELRKTKYFEKVKFNEERDNKLRLEEQSQRKLFGEELIQQNDDAIHVIRSMVSQMEEQTAKQRLSTSQNESFQDSTNSYKSYKSGNMGDDNPTTGENDDLRGSWNPNSKGNV